MALRFCTFCGGGILDGRTDKDRSPTHHGCEWPASLKGKERAKWKRKLHAAARRMGLLPGTGVTIIFGGKQS